MNKRIFAALIAAVLLLTLIVWPTLAQSAAPSRLRVVNGLVGVGAVDVYINGRVMAYNLQAESSSPAYCFAPGIYSVAVRPSGAEPFSAPVTDELVDLSAGATYSAVAYQKVFAEVNGYVPPLGQSGGLFVTAEDVSPIAFGKTRLSATHLAFGSPSTLTVGYPRAPLLYRIGLGQLFGNVDVDPKVYSLTLIDADSADQEPLQRFADASFAANTFNRLVIVPDIQPPSRLLDAPLTTATGSQQARLFTVQMPIEGGVNVRLLHAAWGQTELAVYVDGVLVVPRLTYSESTAYLGLPEGSHQVTIRRAGDAADAAPLSEGLISITPENQAVRHWTLVLQNGTPNNDLAAQGAQLGGSNTLLSAVGSRVMMSLFSDDQRTVGATAARVRLYNAVDELPEVSLFTPNNALFDPPLGTTATPTATLAPDQQPLPNTTPTPVPVSPLVSAATFGGGGASADVPSGFYSNLQLFSRGNSPIITLPAMRLIPGMVYTYVAVGSADNNPPIQLIPFEDYGCDR